MAVPAYYRSRRGHVFRVQRLSQRLGTDGARYALRAIPVGVDQPAAEVARELSEADLRVRLGHGQHVATPEETFEQLWQQLRVDLD